VEQYFDCLDMLQIRTADAGWGECLSGNLLEIWPLGGVIQLDKPLEKGQKFIIQLESTEIEAEVQEHADDVYGSYIRFTLRTAWFPETYQPSYLGLEKIRARQLPETALGEASGTRTISIAAQS
jgi:hypothetical protein